MKSVKRNITDLFSVFAVPKVWITLIVLAGALLNSQSALAVYKCADTSGKILYSDVPCASSQKQQDAYGSEGRVKSATDRIDFGTTRKAQLLKATSILESVRNDGRECESSLKVDDKNLGACLTFLQDLLIGGAWHQAAEKVRSLFKESAAKNEPIQDYETAAKLAQQITEYDDFLKSRLKYMK